MNTSKECALIVILATAAIIGVVPAFASNNPYIFCPACNQTSIQQIPPVAITVTTDKLVYDHSSQIVITGHVANPYSGQDVTLKITSPSGNLVSVSQVSLDTNGDFTKTVSTVGNLWFENGSYTIYVQQGGEQGKVNSSLFQLAGGAPVIPEFGPIAVLVLAIALMSIIAVSTKTGMRLIPRQ